jgi:hypothetical protein
MREVVRTGEPIMLDIMQFGDESFVVMRVPLKDERGRVIGGVGFMLFGGLTSLQPLVGKFRQLEKRLADVQRSLAEERRVKYTFSSFLGQLARRHGREAPGAPRRADGDAGAAAGRNRHGQGSPRAGRSIRRARAPTGRSCT